MQGAPEAAGVPENGKATPVKRVHYELTAGRIEGIQPIGMLRTAAVNVTTVRYI